MKASMRLLFLLVFSFLSLNVEGQRLRDSLLFSDPVAMSLAINSQYEESMPVFSKDSSELYFVRTFHPKNKGGDQGDQDIWMSKRSDDGQWSDAINVDDLNNEENNGAFGINDAGSTIYLLNAYLKKRKTFEKGVAIANKKHGEWEHHPHTLPIPNLKIEGDFYGFHVNGEETILIISNRGVGTLGEEDLYVSLKDSAGGWGSPIHLGPKINTEGYEMSPFLSPSADTLYFSSNGHGGFGEADIFYSVRLDHTWQKWSEPKNLGPQINSEQFDAYFIRSEDEVYWASNRNGGLSDIYTAEVTGYVWPPFPPADFVMDTVTVDPKPGSKVVVRPSPGETVSIENRGDTMWVNVPNDTLFVLNIPEGGKGEVKLESLEEIIYFDLDKYNLTFESERTMERVAAWLKKNDQLYVRLEGHCDIRASQQYNMWLSEQRVLTAKNYLIKAGIDESRLNGAYYGEEDLAVKTPSVKAPEPEHHRNRRVTITFGSYDEIQEIAESRPMPDIPKNKNYHGGRGSYTQSTNTSSQNSTNNYTSASVSTIEEPSEVEEGLIYRVQIFTSGKELSEDDPRLKDAESVSTYKHGGLIKYTSGEFSSLQEANQHKQACREKGFSGAFVVKFKDGKRKS